MTSRWLSGTDVDNSAQSPAVLSFCSGYGGIERGLEIAGFEHRTVAYVEIEAFAIANLVAKMETEQLVPAPVYTDLKTFPAECFRDRIKLITAGYPCQPFSQAGGRKGTDDPRHLWPYIRQHIESIRPLRVFFENVSGHISLGLREVLKELESLGYRATWGIFSASECFAPHERQRIFILAYSNSYDEPDGPVNEQRLVADSDRESVRRGRIHREPDQQRRKPGAAQREGLQREIRETHINQLEQGRETVAHPGSQGQRITHSLEKSPGWIQQQPGDRNSEGTDGAEVQSGSIQSIPNADGEGLEGRVQHEIADQKRREEQTIRFTTQRSDRREGGRNSEGPFIGELGRGYDGRKSWLDGSWELGIPRVTEDQPNRVDRLRLLGNGVVPDTAATAWIVLNERLNGD